MNILELTADEVKRFFLEHENYFSLKLPDYINFQELLDKLSDEMGEEIYTSILEEGTLPDNYDDINYTLYNNKDGNYDWRSFQIINPVIYISLIKSSKGIASFFPALTSAVSCSAFKNFFLKVSSFWEDTAGSGLASPALAFALVGSFSLGWVSVNSTKLSVFRYSTKANACGLLLVMVIV